ncbi:hypothetical protein [Microbacterium sp. SLBN-146]|uniref:phage major capsid protein n=1 Tax=Microbacterium sp. SLBN-146 TaxID=2768457 RepID=UPI00114E4EBC|nr:hypothetical protein [Microbacterium sp. SLBN-146]
MADTRTIRGLLLPFGELSRPNLSETAPVRFSAGVVKLPADPSVATLYDEHDHFSPLGRATALVETERGIEATFAIAETEEGDAYLANPVRKLSAEIAPGWTREGENAISARLTGAAVCAEGSFESAALFSVAPGDEADERPITAEELAEIAARLSVATAALAAHQAVTPETPEAAPAEDTPQETKEESEVTSIVPETGADNPVQAGESASAFFAAVTSRDASALAALETPDEAGALFAISPIQHSGPSAVTIGADVQQTGYLGELWSGNAYQRKYIPLFHQRDLTNYEVRGWSWVTKPTVAAYAGNNAEIPSNAVDTAPVTAQARRIAGGHRIDRRYLDFNDQSVIESYFRLMSESYAKVSDADILAKAVTAAGSATNITPVSGVNAVYAGIIQGALQLVANDITPTFAVVDPSVYGSVLYELDKEKLAHLSASFGLTGGTFDGFQIVPGTVGTDNVLVGASQALTVFELPGAPIRVEGLAPHHGAIDPALYGYLADITNDSRGLVLKHTTPA